MFRFPKFVLSQVEGLQDGGRPSQGLYHRKEMQIDRTNTNCGSGFRTRDIDFRASEYNWQDDKNFHSVEVRYIIVSQSNEELVYKNDKESFQGLELLQQRIEKMWPFMSQGDVSTEIDQCKTQVEEISK